MTCVLWYEHVATLKQIASWTPGSAVNPNALSQAAIPSTSFRKWVVQLLATTHQLYLSFKRRLRDGLLKYDVSESEYPFKYLVARSLC